ncbi:MAG TPA: MG2 domain-containing protein, partial [Pseudomonadota bacterium]|nr:MG2 domain-containing protein [Pseudomonadota bacterium]
MRLDLTARLTAPALQAVPWRAMGLSALARMVREDLAERDGAARAYELAEQGKSAFPGSPGAKECQSLLSEIAAPHLALAAMLVDAADKPSLQITHRNARELYFRAYAVELSQLLLRRETANLLPDGDFVERLVYGDDTGKVRPARPVAAWTTALQATPDFKDHVTYVTPPLAARGLYVIVASYRADFARTLNQVTAVAFQRSDLALVSHSGSDGSASVAVVEAATGQPARGARVELYRTPWERRAQRVDSRVVDASGTVRFAGRNVYEDFTLVAQRGPDRVIFGSSLSLAGDRDHSESIDELIYTDRAIYRPQQKLYFKILAYAGRSEEGRFRLRPRQRLTVRLRDANYQEIAKREVTTNSFGTAAGEFALPAGRLLGGWSLDTRSGHASFRVEEYKRPGFEVTLAEAKEPLRLNRPALLRGEAHYYFGQPVSQGTVKYRLTRQTVAPPQPLFAGGRGSLGRLGGRGRHGRFGLFAGREQVTVASGEAALRPDGTFAVQFTPEADEQHGKDFTYTYTLSADLTDEGGETRSASRAFRLGFVAIEAALSSDFGYLPSGTAGSIKAVRRSLDGSGRAG